MKGDILSRVPMGTFLKSFDRASEISNFKSQILKPGETEIALKERLF
jgi:hypothetical protein